MPQLPRTEAESVPPAVPAVLDRDSALRVLLVEDSPSDRALEVDQLGREFRQASIDVADTLAAAVTKLEGADYDLVLSDLGLPDADGDDVVRALRAASPHTALVVLTGRSDEHLALLALAEGAQDYLVKGEHGGRQLAEALLHALQRNRTEQRARHHLAVALEMESAAVRRLRELNDAKDEFVKVASHELRTPLSSIVAFAELLTEEGLTPVQATHAEAIARNADRLVALVEDLTVVATSSVRRPRGELPTLDLRVVVAAAQDVVAPLAEEKGLDVRYDVPARPVLVAGEARQLERVVLNLMSNAIKFTDDGYVVCRVTDTPADICLAVSDTGMGIPPAEQDRLFESFFRGSAARAHAIPGTGLGLYICATIVHDHRGEITVDSTEGRGSTFTIRLPALAPDASRSGAGG